MTWQVGSITVFLPQWSEQLCILSSVVLSCKILLLKASYNWLCALLKFPPQVVGCKILFKLSTFVSQRYASLICITVVTRMSSPSFLGQISLAASITVPVGPQQSSCREERPTQSVLLSFFVSLWLVDKFIKKKKKKRKLVLTPKWMRRRVSFSASCLVSFQLA